MITQSAERVMAERWAEHEAQGADERPTAVSWRSRRAT